MANVDGSANAPSASESQRREGALKDDNDLDPAAFLKSVRELSEKRDREDLERYRKLEEEVQKGREERAARRAERARSISPEKRSDLSAPTGRPLSRTTTNASLVNSPPITMTPPTSTTEPAAETPSQGEDVPEFKGFGSIKRSSTTASRTSQSPTSAQNATSTPTPSASHLARSGTLSWQQRPRPGSRLGGSRPQSMIEANSTTTPSRDALVDEVQPSRDQISASLGARDPTWFRQTADRGIGNAAYRKSKEEATDGESLVSGRRGLPGMSPAPSIEPEPQSTPPVAESVRSDISRGGSLRESTFSNDSARYSTTSTSSSRPDLKSLIAADEDQQRASPSFDRTSVASNESGSMSRTLTMSSSQARLANVIERPGSPTKGMGGFVQSAMMKRNDSQTKRWSAQPAAALSRNNSVASTRSGLGSLQGSQSMPRLEPGQTTHEITGQPTSSSSNDLTGLAREQHDFVKPALPQHSRNKSVTSTYNAGEDGVITQSPGSPSKRWSPNKSSWLESSLTRPESPKITPAKNSQPSWMANLAKAKAQRSTADLAAVTSSDHGNDIVSGPTSQPGSPVKSPPAFGQSMLRRPESREMSSTAAESASSAQLQSLARGDKFNADTGASDFQQPIQRHGGRTLDAPIELASLETPQSNDPQVLPSRVLAGGNSTSPLKDSTDEARAIVSCPVNSSDSSGTKSTFNVNSDIPQSSASGTPASTEIEAKAKPTTPAKPSTDFRGLLKSRPPTADQPKEEPEFLSKFGNLRKAQQEKYVAPDILKNNILRGKSGLAVTGGPVKTPRRDELKESLLAKKDDIKKAKEEGRDLPGQAHERKTSSGVPQPPSKPEALAKRELLGRSDSTKSMQTTAPVPEATPEALFRHRSLKSISQPVSTGNDVPQDDGGIPSTLSRTSSKPQAETTPLTKEASESKAAPAMKPSETSKLASRFNPGLAGILARGPFSEPSSRSGSPKVQQDAGALQAAGAPLQDMRKDRAKGPKRRKGARVEANEDSAKPADSSAAPAGESDEAFETRTVPFSTSDARELPPVAKPKPKPSPSALPGSVASLMNSSLGKSPRAIDLESVAQNAEEAMPEAIKPVDRAKPQALSGSAASIMRASLSVGNRDSASIGDSPRNAHTQSASATSQQRAVDTTPDFKGFGAARAQRASKSTEDDKENTVEGSPSVRNAASQWQRQPSPVKNEIPSQIQLPTRRDEEAAMRSAGLLASNSSQTSGGLGISVDKADGTSSSTPPKSAGLPPKPAKSSRIVSGQLAEASPNKGSLNLVTMPKTNAGQLLIDAFQIIPKYKEPLCIDTSALITSNPQSIEVQSSRTIRRTSQLLTPDGSLKMLPPHEEFTFFDESTYLCSHITGARTSEVFIWSGDSASESSLEAASSAARKLSKEHGNAQIQYIRQGQESAGFLKALGGIFVTRRGSGERAPKQYMLCGRKHLGQIVFDEVDFDLNFLCSGFVYFVSYPVTLQETKIYLWKGQGCGADELSAARLAATELSDTNDIIEVDGGAEFPSFLKIFGPDTLKSSVPQPTEIWRQKAMCLQKFKTRLFRIKQTESRTGLFTSLWSRRPSWGSKSPAHSPARDPNEVKVVATELSSITQSQLEPDGIYLLDAFAELHVFIGPLLGTHGEHMRDALLGQALLFASNYATMAASIEDRPLIPKCQVHFSGAPKDVKLLFRHWNDSRGLWGTAGLMAGSSLGSSDQVLSVPLDDMLTEVCRD